MSLTDVAITILVATYAMIGGAMVNAAITAPRRCNAVLDWLHGYFTPLLTSGLALIVVAAGRGYLWPRPDTVTADPLLWLGLAQIFLLLLFLFAARVAVIAQAEDQPKAEAQDERP